MFDPHPVVPLHACTDSINLVRTRISIKFLISFLLKVISNEEVAIPDKRDLPALSVLRSSRPFAAKGHSHTPKHPSTTKTWMINPTSRNEKPCPRSPVAQRLEVPSLAACSPAPQGHNTTVLSTLVLEAR